MNKEALKSIYAYNMLFNNSSGNISADSDVKMNTHLISDFDLQNFDPKRFEYYTTLLKMFDNDPDTLTNVLNKYYSVKSLKVKERKLIRIINDYVNKINKTRSSVGGGSGGGSGVGGSENGYIGGGDGDDSSLIKKIKKLKSDYDIFIKPEKSEGFADFTTKAINMMKDRAKSLSQIEKNVKKEKATKDQFANAINDLKEAIIVFEEQETKTTKYIDNFEESINTFEKIINFQTGGVITNELLQTFLKTNFENKNRGKNTEPIPKDILSLAKEIITEARMEVKLAKKTLSKENLVGKEDNNANGSLKTLIGNIKGIDSMLKEEKKKISDEKISILPAKAEALEAQSITYAHFAKLRAEEVKAISDKAQIELALLPPETQTTVNQYGEKIKKRQIAKINACIKSLSSANEKRKQNVREYNDSQTSISKKMEEDDSSEVGMQLRLILLKENKEELDGELEEDIKKEEGFIAKQARIAGKYEPSDIIDDDDDDDKKEITNVILIQQYAKKAKALAEKAMENATKAEEAIKIVSEANKNITGAINKKDLAKASSLISQIEKEKTLVYGYANNINEVYEMAKEEEATITDNVIANAKLEVEYIHEHKGDQDDLISLAHRFSRGQLGSPAMKPLISRRNQLVRIGSDDGSDDGSHSGLYGGGASPEDKYNDDTLKAQYLEKQRYRSISPRIKEEFRDVLDANKGKVVRIKTDNKIDQLSNDIDIYNALSVEDRDDNTASIIKKIKDFENDPQNPLEELEITLDDRIVFIIATFFIRYITLLMVQWCIDINIITSFYEGFIYYAIIYIILFWFVVLFINIDNSYDVKYMNFNGIINSIRSLFYYFYMGTNGISRLLIHTSLIILLIVIPIILNIKKKPEFRDEANDEPVANVKILTYDERKQLSKTLTLFTMFIWLFTSIIATKF
jgi:hypothetical protein